jgi:hypothetical protein
MALTLLHKTDLEGMNPLVTDTKFRQWTREQRSCRHLQAVIVRFYINELDE